MQYTRLPTGMPRKQVSHSKVSFQQGQSTALVLQLNGMTLRKPFQNRIWWRAMSDEYEDEQEKYFSKCLLQILINPTFFVSLMTLALCEVCSQPFLKYLHLNLVPLLDPPKKVSSNCPTTFNILVNHPFLSWFHWYRW